MGRKLDFIVLGATYEHFAGYLDSLFMYARSVGLEPGKAFRVIDPGERVSELAQALDIFWMTSPPLSEGIPTAIEEAMALGLPVVSTDVGAIREAVDTDCGYVVPPEDAHAIALVTQQLISNQALRLRMSRRATEVARQRFDVTRCVREHLRAFELAMHQS
jgi:glycosyltransferase involved in cell wall biosynthesis